MCAVQGLHTSDVAAVLRCVSANVCWLFDAACRYCSDGDNARDHARWRERNDRMRTHCVHLMPNTCIQCVRICTHTHTRMCFRLLTSYLMSAASLCPSSLQWWRRRREASGPPKSTLSLTAENSAIKSARGQQLCTEASRCRRIRACVIAVICAACWLLPTLRPRTLPWTSTLVANGGAWNEGEELAVLGLALISKLHTRLLRTQKSCSRVLSDPRDKHSRLAAISPLSSLPCCVSIPPESGKARSSACACEGRFGRGARSASGCLGAARASASWMHEAPAAPCAAWSGSPSARGSSPALARTFDV